jgi:hypothetical protein
VSGVVLLISMFLPWFGEGEEVEPSSTTFDVSHQLEAAGVALEANAWEAFTVIDLVLLAAALAGFGFGLVVALRLAQRYVDLARRLTLILGLLAVAVILYRVGSPAPGQATEEAGLFLGIAAAAGIAYGGLRSMGGADKRRPVRGEEPEP